MKKNQLLIIAGLGLLLSALSACSAAPTEVTPDIETRVAQTLQALATPVTPATLAPSNTPAPTDTPAPTETSLPTETSTPTDTLEPTNTQVPLSTPTSTLPPGTPATAPPTGGAVLSDNFDSGTGWYVNEGQNAVFEYADGGYQITNNLVSGQFWSIRSVEPTNTIQQVDAKRKSGPEDGYYGVVCRHQEDGMNYYAFVIGSDGFYGIAMMEDGAFSFLIQGQDSQDIINTDEGAFNRLRGDCNGDRLSLYVNNFFLVQVQNEQFTSGSIGMFNGTRQDPGLVVLFDNFSVSVP